MKIVDNLSIRSKLITGFGIILICAVGLGAFSVARINLLTADGGLLEDNSQGNMGLSFMARDAETMARLAAQTTSAKTPAQLQNIAAMESQIVKEYATNWSAYAPGMDPGDETHNGTGFNAAWGQITATFAQISRAQQAGDADSAAALVNGDLTSEIANFDQFMNSDLAYQSAQTVSYGTAESAASSSSIYVVFAYC